MREKFIQYLACPSCQNGIVIHSVRNREGPSIESGELKCIGCRKIFPIVGFIPRFVTSDNYAKGFGMQWLKHRETQLDSYTGLNISEKRFFEQTHWARDLRGQMLLEAGCGAGRFTEHAAAAGAMVFSFDLSLAVEANYKNNGHRENVLVLQASIYDVPFKKRAFDKVFCFGVLQHTPDPFKSFVSLVSFIRDGGEIAVDVYRNYWKAWLISKYYLRPLTRNMDPERLYRLVINYIDFMWPLCSWIRKLPGGEKFNLAMGIPDHSGLGVREDLLKQWACLDCFDMFAARYDYPQTIKTIKRWFESQGLKKVEVGAGDLGIVVGRGTKG